MIQIQKLKPEDIGLSRIKNLPSYFTLLTDIQEYDADIDIVIGSHNKSHATNLTIENYLSLEKKKSLHILVIESSRNPLNFFKIQTGKNISKVLILNEVRCTKKKYEPSFWGSNGAAIAAQIGMYFGQSRYVLFSHTDMMGYKENFLSFLSSKLNENTPIASFTQRAILPFTGGMLFDKSYFKSINVEIDWLPHSDNPYKIPGIDNFRNTIDTLNWTDAGERLPLEAFKHGQTAYVCASRGMTRDFYEHPLTRFNLSNEGLMKQSVPIHYAATIFSKEEFAKKYPELALEEISMWRKSFDDDGDVVFIHRGRGTTRKQKNDKRGDFEKFVRQFNKKRS